MGPGSGSATKCLCIVSVGAYLAVSDNYVCSWYFIGSPNLMIRTQFVITKMKNARVEEK